MSPQGAIYPALRDQANGLGSRIPSLFGLKPCTGEIPLAGQKLTAV